MPWYKELLFIGLLLVQRSLCVCDSVSGPKIAIIGAGIGGASTAHFLTELFNRNVEIDIFEKESIGGRLATAEVDGQLYESGGSKIHPRNKYMKDFVKLLRLEKKETSEASQSFAIWDEFRFAFVGNSVEMLEETYGKQNLAELFRTLNSFLDDFDKIYDDQVNGLAYKNVHDLISAMNSDFPKLLRVSAAEYFSSLGLSNRTIYELIEAALVENYGQSTQNVHSFVGLVSVAGAVVTTGGGLWSVRGGNKKVPVKLIETNLRVKVTFARVTEIRYLPPDEFQTHCQYEISFRDKETNTLTKNIYDVVVIAAPMPTGEKQSIEFVGFPETFDPLILRKYRRNVKAYIQPYFESSLLFEMRVSQEPSAIISCKPLQSGMNSLSKVLSINGSTEIKSPVWKISSSYDIHDWLHVPNLLAKWDSKSHSMVERKVVWDAAYPEYSTVPVSYKFELHDSLYHVNAIEWAASAMEMSAIGGRNVALLIHKNFASRC